MSTTATNESLALDPIAENALADAESKPVPPEVKPPDPKDKGGDSKLKCPKCGAFCERVQVAVDDRLPGLYCNKENCGWSDPLDKPALIIRDARYCLTDSLIALLKLAPLNGTARAHVHAIMNMPIPRACITYDQICTWIATVEISKSKVPDLLRDWPRVSRNPDLPGPAQNNHAVSARIDYSFREYGTSSYSCTQSGTDDYHLRPEDVLDIAQTSESFEGFYNLCKMRLIKDAEEDPPETQPDGYEYDGETSEGSEDYNTSIHSSAALRDSLLCWLHDNHPDQYARLTR